MINKKTIFIEKINANEVSFDRVVDDLRLNKSERDYLERYYENLQHIAYDLLDYVND